MNTFDLWVLHVINGHVGQWPAFDSFLLYLANAHLLKMFPMVLMLISLWFQGLDDPGLRHDELVRVFIGSVIAMATTRSLEHLLPFRPRPINDDSVTVLLHQGVKPDFLDSMSSLPSDHAGLAFALVTGIMLLNRRYGMWALAHATFVICLPRLYFGFHYLSDLVLGATVGIISSWLAMRLPQVGKISFPLLHLEAVRPALFYALFFLAAYQTAEMYDGTRALAHAAASSLHRSVIAMSAK